jgi:hypothetical protein
LIAQHHSQALKMASQCTTLIELQTCVPGWAGPYCIDTVCVLSSTSTSRYNYLGGVCVGHVRGDILFKTTISLDLSKPTITTFMPHVLNIVPQVTHAWREKREREKEKRRERREQQQQQTMHVGETKAKLVASMQMQTSILRPANKPPGLLADWLTVTLASWLADWLADRLTDWLAGWLAD